VASTIQLTRPRPPRPVVTDRLLLYPVSIDDLDVLFGIFSEPAGWWYDPAGRHMDVSTTRGGIDRAADRWARDGLSYWTVGLADGGRVIGLGGAQRRATGTWNLNYRLAAEHWGHGYATELAQAALTAAGQHDARVPVVAWIAEHNWPSRRVVERIGLINYGLRIDEHDGQARLAYADRALDGGP